ncbi:MAG: Peptidase C14 caspase catalytic subunit [Desulfovibrionaceae bacterium]|nr:MAG: Peptidase C14 caspase catalytic subunit [Desulfovibrionaceae bacterium]
MRRLVTLMSLVCLLVLWTIPAQAERRVALVIGNSTYKVTPLKNPVNDARDIVAALKALGFEVTLLTDATHQQMETAVREFGAKLQKGGVGLFFYAGHGVQVSGENYLVPIDSSMAVEADVKYGSLNAGKVLAQMEDAGNELNIVILDACRTNPFARSFRSAEQGLARMDAPKGSLIAYATAPGKVAADSGGGGRNSPYTSSLLRHMRTPGLKLEDTLKRVRVDVMRSTSEKQIPWDYSSLTGDFYFSQPLAQPLQAATASVSTPVSAEKKDKTLGDVFAGLFKKSEPQTVAIPQQATIIPVPQAHDQQQAQQAADAELQALQSELVKHEQAANDAKNKAERKKIEAGKVVLRKRIEDAKLAKEQAEIEGKEIEGNSPEGWFKLGQQEYNKINYTEAVKWFRKAAERGHAHSQGALGLAYYYGQGISQNYVESANAFRKAAEQGEPLSQAYIGMMYNTGSGIPQNALEGVKWLHKSAEQENSYGCFYLGDAYSKGIGVNKDFKEALRYYKLASGQGNAMAQSAIGNMYLDGLGVKLDYEEAHKWFSLAARQGERSALLSLGLMSMKGLGMARNYSEAYRYLIDSAKQGNAYALATVGWLYSNGLGVEKNDIIAYTYFSLGVQKGFSVAKSDVERLKREMGSIQLSEAENAVRTWRTLSAKELGYPK